MKRNKVESVIRVIALLGVAASVLTGCQQGPPKAEAPPIPPGTENATPPPGAGAVPGAMQPGVAPLPMKKGGAK